MKTANLAAIVVFATLLAACSMPALGTGDTPAATRVPSADLPNAILGKWEKADSPIVTIEFFKDGKIDVTNSTHWTGTYKFIGDDRIQIETETYSAKTILVHEIYLSGDELTVIDRTDTASSVGSIMRLKRTR